MDPKQLEFESILEAYPVRLINFEGPLDLLLHLIKKNEMNVYDIPISTVTQQTTKRRLILRRRDDENLPNPGEHERRERVVDHRFVVDGCELFGHRA
jgi:hypothetical protein